MSVYVVVEVWPGSCGPGVVSEQCCMARNNGVVLRTYATGVELRSSTAGVFYGSPGCMSISLTGCSLHCAV